VSVAVSALNAVGNVRPQRMRHAVIDAGSPVHAAKQSSARVQSALARQAAISLQQLAARQS
jgi:hypothetical protein